MFSARAGFPSCSGACLALPPPKQQQHQHHTVRVRKLSLYKACWQQQLHCLQQASTDTMRRYSPIAKPAATPTTIASAALGEVLAGGDAAAEGSGVAESTRAATGKLVSWAQLPAMALALA